MIKELEQRALWGKTTEPGLRQGAGGEGRAAEKLF